MKKQKLNFRSSWDDGSVHDHKLIDLLIKYKIPAIFYISGDTSDDAQIDIGLIDSIVKNGFELGGHTVHHFQDLKLLDETTLFDEIAGNKIMMEKLSGQKITSFCYPRGRYDDRAINILKGLGFIEARTTEVLKVRWSDPFRTPTAIHVRNRQEYNGTDWMQKSYEMVDEAIKENGVFHIWGHSWEIERNNDWAKLEMFFDWLVNNYELVK